MPLVHTFTLSKKKGNEAYIEPIYANGHYDFKVRQGKIKDEGTINRKGAKCLHCGSGIDYPYIRNESCEGRMGNRLIIGCFLSI